MSEYCRAGHEPPLSEILADPIVRLVMRRDGLEATDLLAVAEAARRRWLRVPGDGGSAVPTVEEKLTTGKPAAGLAPESRHTGSRRPR
jgi:hypothetical protein